MGVIDETKKIVGKFGEKIFNKNQEKSEKDDIDTNVVDEEKNSTLEEQLKAEKEEILKLPMYTDVKWEKQDNLDKKDVKSVFNMVKKIQLFNQFKDRQIKKIIPLFYERHFSKNEYLFKKGHPGSCLFIIKNGQVNIQEETDGASEDQKVLVYSTLSNGAMFGEMSLTSNAKRNADALCKTDTDVYVLFRQDLMELFEKEPNVGVKLFSSINAEMSLRINRTNDALIVEQLENRKLKAYIESIYAQKTLNPEEPINLLSVNEVLYTTSYREAKK